MFWNRITVLVLQGMVVVLTLVIAGGIIWFLLNLNTEGERTADVVEIIRLQTAAQVYYNRLEFYTGVCRDIGARPPFSCHDSEEAYAIEVNIPKGGYHCVDSTGFNGTIAISKLNSTKCP